MRNGTRIGRKSDHLKKSQLSEVSPELDPSYPNIVDLEHQADLVYVVQRRDKDSIFGRMPQSSNQKPESELEYPVVEENIMTWLRYKRFKGDGSQDEDDWLWEFESTALANQENDVAQRRIFGGLLKEEALK